MKIELELETSAPVIRELRAAEEYFRAAKVRASNAESDLVRARMEAETAQQRLAKSQAAAAALLLKAALPGLDAPREAPTPETKAP